MTKDEGRTTKNTATALAVLLVLVCVLAAGCSRDIETAYGQRKGPGASQSVNGTAVLGEMFEQAGHKVFSWHALSPRLADRADCIVWFPDDFEPPGDDVCDWLERWLGAAPGRTLIYVGRDFDAAAWYWKKVQSGAPAEQLAELKRRLAEARRDFRSLRRLSPGRKDCPWFTVDDQYRPRKVRSLSGDSRWLGQIDPERLAIELNGRIVPGPTAQVLLESEGDLLVSRDPRSDSRLIVVANGSFLLNLPLVNHEHRKLAGKLIDQVGPPGQTVVFLESDAGGPPIRSEDPTARTPSGLEILLLHPLSWIFVQFAIVGVLFCFSRWPIFGLPRELEVESTADFGKHVRALAELLERSRDQAYAMDRFLHYQEVTKGRET
jgi:hypothetical protein